MRVQIFFKTKRGLTTTVRGSGSYQKEIQLAKDLYGVVVEIYSEGLPSGTMFWKNVTALKEEYTIQYVETSLEARLRDTYSYETPGILMILFTDQGKYLISLPLYILSSYAEVI